MYFERTVGPVVVSGLVVGSAIVVFVAATAVADFAIVAGTSSGHDPAKQSALLAQRVRQDPHADCDLQ